MAYGKDIYKLITGKPKDELLRQPSYRASLDKLWMETQSADNLLYLGYAMNGDMGDIHIAQGMREGLMTIIGAPGEGKSKLLEHLICRDIDRLIEKGREAPGLCLIDPSAQGDTLYKVLAYCAAKGFNKVFLVDPHTLYSKGIIASVNPFNCAPTYMERAIAELLDGFRVLFGVTDPANTAFIETYLPAIFTLIYKFGGTLHDAMYFTTPPKADVFFDAKRDIVINNAEGDEIIQKYASEVAKAYQNYPIYKQEVSSTVRRMNQIFHNKPFDLIFGHRQGANFDKLISDGWVILVNVSDEYIDTLPARLLATLIINQIIFSTDRLRRHGYNKPYYLYIDEASQFANRKVADLTNLRRKSNLRLILSYQFPGQFEDKYVRQSVDNGARIKAAFYISDPVERRSVMESLGFDKESEVFEALSRQEKQSMIIRINKNEPVLARVPDTPDIDIDVTDYIHAAYSGRS